MCKICRCIFIKAKNVGVDFQGKGHAHSLFRLQSAASPTFSLFSFLACLSSPLFKATPPPCRVSTAHKPALSTTSMTPPSRASTGAKRKGEENRNFVNFFLQKHTKTTTGLTSLSHSLLVHTHSPPYASFFGVMGASAAMVFSGKRIADIWQNEWPAMFFFGRFPCLFTFSLFHGD